MVSAPDVASDVDQALAALRANTGLAASTQPVTVAWPDGPTPAERWPVLTAAVTSVAAATAAAADLLAARTGRATTATVDAAHAWASFQSERLLRVDGHTLPHSHPITGDYPTRDGRFVRLHGGFAAHRRAVFTALSLRADATADDVAGAVTDRTALTVEQDVVRHGGAAGAMRTTGQWRAHDQGKALLATSAVTLTRVAPGTRRPLTPAARAAQGVRVLDLSRVIAGPVAARVMASHGATVLRVGAPPLEQVPHLWVDTGFGKGSAEVDLRLAAGRRLLRQLIDDADVVIDAFRPGALSRLGFSAARCTAGHRGLVWVTLSAWGPRGPWRHRRGYDSVVQMTSGLAAPDPDEQGPQPLSVQALDHAAGWLAAAAAMTALARQHREGGSWHAQTSLGQMAAWLAGMGRSEGKAPSPTAWTADPWMAELDSAYGRLRFVRPPGVVDGIPCDYPSAPTRGGTHPPAWP